MGANLDATSDYVTATDTTCTRSHTCSGSNRLLMAHVAVNGQDSATVKYNAVSMTLHTRFNISGRRHEIWYLVAPDTGTNNIVVTTGSAAEIAIAGTSFTEVNQSSPIGTTSDNSNSSTFVSVSSTVTSTGIAIDFLLTDQNGSSQAADAGQTNARSFNGGNFDLGTSIETGAGSVTMGWTWTGVASNRILVAPINDAPATSPMFRGS